MGPQKIIRFTRKFGLRGEKCIGLGKFDQKICSNYAEFTVHIEQARCDDRSFILLPFFISLAATF